MKKCFIVICSLAAIGCASLPISKSTQRAIAISAGCKAMEAAGCFDGLQKVIPGINADNCADTVNYMVELTQGVSKAAREISKRSAKIEMDKWRPEEFDVKEIDEVGSSCYDARSVLGVQ